LVATVALLLAALPAAQAANGTWTGGTSTTWATTANWLGGTVAGSTSANADIATFNSGTYSFSPTAANNYFLGGLSFGESNGPITITTGANSARLNVNSGGIQVASGSGAVTIGTSTTGGINLTASQSWVNNSTSLLTIIRASVDETAANGTYTITINGSGSGGVNVASGLHDSTSNTKDPTRNVAVIINSTGGAATFNAASTYSGGTTLTAGTLQLGASSVGSVGAITTSAIGTGGLALNGGTLSSSDTTARTILNAITIGGDVTLGDATKTGALTFSADAAIDSSTRTLTTASAATFSGNITGTGGITKAGSGALTLTGNNTYTGGTTVSTGTLMVNNTSGSGTGSESLLVSAGATLGGSGAIAGITTISGILAPGNSIGTLTVANDVTWNGSLLSDGTANWKFELGAANTADLLRITGGASEFIKGSGSVFCFDFLGSTETGLFTLVDWDSTAFVGGGFAGTSFAATDFTYTNLGNSNTGTFQFNGSQLQFQAIPEPSAGVLMLIAGTALFVLRRRRMQ
jgi:autotransporter-associated beta strand protein